MVSMISGTIHDMVKLAEQNSKWEQKKKNGGKAAEKELTPEERQIKRYQEDLEKMRESNQMASVCTKARRGGQLTPEELAYLKKNNPECYREYLEIEKEKEAYERQLETCRTKEEVEELKLQKTGEFLAETKEVANNANIPKGKKLGLLEKILGRLMGVMEVHMSFVKSARYQNLPADAKEKEQRSEGLQGAEEVRQEPEQQSMEELQGAEEVRQEPEQQSMEELQGAGEVKRKQQPQETKQKPQYAQEVRDGIISFEDVKRDIMKYLRENRESGSGLEFF